MLFLIKHRNSQSNWAWPPKNFVLKLFSKPTLWFSTWKIPLILRDYFPTLPEEASFPRRKYYSIDTDYHNLTPWNADRRRQIPKKDLLRSKQCGLEVTYKFITHFNTDFASQPFPAVFWFCYPNHKYDMSVVSLSYLPVSPLQLFALNQTREDWKELSFKWIKWKKTTLS